jgi:WD40 repeat protein/serine/threonine protein kinase
MNPDKEREKRLFIEALKYSTPEQRAEFLGNACGENTMLRQQVELLLAANEEAGDFLERPPAAVSPNTLVISSGAVLVTEKPGDTIGRYKLREQIGEGGCGVVYVAEQEQPVRRRVALKIIKLGMDTKQVVARFEAERQALALMDHPNIAKVLDAGATETGRPYFVMELVRGIKITDYCDKNNLSTRERLNLFIQVCAAIQHAHQKGVIHRDVKPSNVLVTLHDGVPVPKVIDFGIAKATSDQRLTDKTIYTAFEQFIGTPAYMSPEQAEMSGLDIDTRSDIYSLGVLLYELLTGRTPLDAATLLRAGLDEMRRIIREQEPQRPSTRLSTLQEADLTTIAKHRHAEAPKLISLLRGDLDWIVIKALEKDRTRRFETVNALATDIKRHLDNEPIAARPPSQLYRLQKVVQRNKFACAAAGAVGVALLLGLGLSTWLFIREREAHKVALSAEHQQSILRAEAEKERRAAEAHRHEAELQTLNATNEKARADEQARIAIGTLQQMKIQRAEDLFKADNTSLALALLAQVLRENPSNLVAAQRIMSALTERNFLIPRFALQGSNQLAAFSKDGSWLATVGPSNHLAILDSNSGRLVAGPVGLSNAVSALEFSADAAQLLVQSSNQVTLWNSTSLVRSKDCSKLSQEIVSAHFTPYGPRVISADGGNVFILDMSGTVLAGPLEHDFDGAELTIFSRDGNRLAVSSRNSDLRIWDARTGVPLTAHLKAGGSGPTFCFSPDGKAFIVGSWGSAHAYFGDTSVVPLKHMALNHPACIPSVDFNPDGRTFVTGADDGTVRVWDASTGKLRSESIHRDGGIRTVQFDSSGKRLMSSSADHTIRLWSADSGQPITEPLRHQGGLHKVEMSSDARSVLLVSETNAQVWDLRPGKALPEVQPSEAQQDQSIVSPDGIFEVELQGHYNGRPTQARILDHRTRRPLIGDLIFEANVFSVRFSPDSQRIALGIGRVNGKAKGRAEIFDIRTGRKVMELPSDDWAAKCAEFSPDGRMIATGSMDGNVRLWDAQTSLPITAPLDDGGELEYVIFGPNSDILLTVGGGQTAHIWNARKGIKLHDLTHDGNINVGSFSPNGALVVTAGDDRTARIWEVKSGKMLHDLRHGFAVVRVVFSPDAKMLATSSQEGTVRVWNVAAGQQITEPLLHSSRQKEFSVFSLEFTNNAKQLAIGMGDGKLLWDLPEASDSAPLWLADLAEAVAGRRLGDRMQLTSVPVEDIFSVKSRIERNRDPMTDPYLRFAKWFFADKANRAISPLSKISVRNYFQNCATAENPRLFRFEGATQLPTDDIKLQQRLVKAGERLEQIDRAVVLREEAYDLRHQGRLDEAEAAFAQALMLKKQLFGSESYDVANLSYAYAGMLHSELKKFPEAESLYRASLAVRMKVLGPENHEVADVLDALADCLIAQRKFAEAEVALRENLAIRFGSVDNKRNSPYEQWYPDSVLKLVLALREQGKVVEIENVLGEIAKGGNNDWLNEIAWRLATSSNSRLRNGAQAVALAMKGVEKTDRKDHAVLDTLAAAYAEAGQFDRAVSAEREATSLLNKSEPNEDYLSRLKLYQSNTPYHEKD